METTIRRLKAGDVAEARTLFRLMATVFEEESDELSDVYLSRLLGRDSFWAMAALSGDHIVGGITAHELPMTRTETPELFLYDIAIHPDFQRRGVGRQLVEALRQQGSVQGIDTVFVAADEEDVHALDFYRALGGTPSPVTIFTFGTTRVPPDRL